MKLFHGTSYNRFLKIQESGYLGSLNPIWNASRCETTYFYNESWLLEEVEEEELVHSEGLRMGKESAEIVLAQEKSNLKRVVLVFDSEDLDQDYLSKDESCGENMMHCTEYSKLLPLDLVKEIWMDEEFLDLYSLLFIGNAFYRNNNQYSHPHYTIYMGENQDLPSSVVIGAMAFWEAVNLDWLEDISYNFELEKIYSKDETLINPVDIQILN